MPTTGISPVTIARLIKRVEANIRLRPPMVNLQNLSLALKGCNEIIMHKDGIITEAGASNVFFIIDNAICTPSLNNNILPGITRDMSIKIFRKNNINVFEDNFSIEQLLSASKVWLTSSTKGMAEVTDVYSENHSIESENTLFNKCEDIFRTAFFND